MVGDVERLRNGMRLISGAVTAFADASGDYDQLLKIVAQSSAEVIGDTCAVSMLEPSGELRTYALFSTDPAAESYMDEFSRTPLRPGDPSTAWNVMSTGHPVFLPTIQLDAIKTRMSSRNYELMSEVGIHSLILVAMRVRSVPLGVVALWRHRPSSAPFDKLDLELAQDLANHAALAISNARLVEALRQSEELRVAQQSSIRANRFLDAIIEHIPDMVFVKDAEHLAFTRFNRAGEELLGVSRTALIGKTDYDLFPADEAKFFQAKDRETLAAKSLVEIAEEPIQTAAGPRWLHTKKVPILDEDGTPLYLLGISHDITARKRADEELRAAKEMAELASKELEAFSYSVAHDLRAPLRGIDGFSQALLDDYGDRLDEVGRSYLERCRKLAQRMAELIDDLLALSRVTRAELGREPVDIGTLGRAAAARLQRAEPDRKVEIVIAPNMLGEADPRLLSVALDNLLGNAWKFSSKVAGARIELGTEVTPSGPAYFVRDNGAGFDQQYAHQLFGVFQRLHTEVEFPGTGIGLATVARIIHRHRGRVWAEGAIGKGATFYFTLGDREAV